jgi:hypothetical protein
MWAREGGAVTGPVGLCMAAEWKPDCVGEAVGRPRKTLLQLSR